ncbi:MAG: hypothetical protein QM756_00470 [Polyangiaceae bacterium]
MPDFPSRARSAARFRNGLIVAGLVLPAVLFFLFERQATRLDALARHGAAVSAVVSAVSERGVTSYAYRVDGVTYSWSAARAEAPFAPGDTFAATYLPEDPSLSRPISEPALAAREAAANRSLAWKVSLGLALVLFLTAWLTQRDVRRLQAGESRQPLDAAAYRRRLVSSGVPIAVAVAAMSGLHIRDALARGESVAPVLLALGLSLLLVGALFLKAARLGPMKVGEWSSLLLRWVVPLAGAAALLRLVMLLSKR